MIPIQAEVSFLVHIPPITCSSHISTVITSSSSLLNWWQEVINKLLKSLPDVLETYYHRPISWNKGNWSNIEKSFMDLFILNILISLVPPPPQHTGRKTIFMWEYHRAVSFVVILKPVCKIPFLTSELHVKQAYASYSMIVPPPLHIQSPNNCELSDPAPEKPRDTYLVCIIIELNIFISTPSSFGGSIFNFIWTVF